MGGKYLIKKLLPLQLKFLVFSRDRLNCQHFCCGIFQFHILNWSSSSASKCSNLLILKNTLLHKSLMITFRSCWKKAFIPKTKTKPHCDNSACHLVTRINVYGGVEPMRGKNILISETFACYRGKKTVVNLFPNFSCLRHFSPTFSSLFCFSRKTFSSYN